MQKEKNTKSLIRVNPIIEKIEPYRVVKQEIWDFNINDFYKLDWNEESFIHEEVKKKGVDFILSNKSSFYPDVSANAFRAKIAEVYNINIKNIIAFNGSDEALDVICRTYLSPGDKVFFRHPEYSNFEIFAKSNGGILNRYYDNDPFKFDIQKYFNFVSRVKPKMVYISNPNNPTGLYLKKEKLLEAITMFQETLFIIDEAYIHFVGFNNDQNYWVKNVCNYNNIIVVRTFSKLFSLAGYRIGFIVASQNLLDNIQKIHKSKNVSMLSQVLATETLNHISYYENKTKLILKQRDDFIRFCKKLSYVSNVYESEGNFICIRLATSVEYFINFLLKYKIYVRNRDYIDQLDSIIRITIVPDMEKIKKVFLEYQESLKI